MVSEGFYRTALEAAQKSGDQTGKVFLVTGAYSGIGVETVKALLAVNGHVVLGGRNEAAMKEFVDALVEQGYEKSLIDGDGPLLDLADLETVQAYAKYVADKYTKLDVLILNAGVMMTPPGVTKQGYETQTGINVVGHFLLAKLLAGITSRQVWLSSKAHEMSGAKRFDFDYFQTFDPTTSEYDMMQAYQQSKLGDILLAKEFTARHENLEAVSLHPGIIQTNLGRNLPGWIKAVSKAMMWMRILKEKTPEQGASTTVTCATLPSADLKNGAYYDDCAVGSECPAAKNEEDMERLYMLCDELTQKYQQ